FDCVHFSWYNRYATKGTGAPSNVHPYELHLGNARTNVSQMLPYTANDMAEYGQLFDNLVGAFQEVFLWIEDVFRVHLSADYEDLARIVESLPGNIGSQVMPFASLVMNLNVWTEAHRDKWDKSLCLVLAIGDFSGGALVLKEQGLVFELRNGNFAVFCSSESTHFNLDFTGRRASFVMQTDIELDKWAKGHNGWSHSDFFL
ncbi:hypothetical protein SCLCIDRAFT_134483, partial [Scleroderma citrinum Foug A]